tara:strand:+ start:632 stop:823 length:192 start_codon:yes stop_codon:yes gene_type:complete
LAEPEKPSSTEKNARVNERFTRAVAEAKKGLLLNRVYLYHAEIADSDIVLTDPIAVYLSFTET